MQITLRTIQAEGQNAALTAAPNAWVTAAPAGVAGLNAVKRYRLPTKIWQCR